MARGSPDVREIPKNEEKNKSKKDQNLHSS
jgi:hypothetical protein